MHQIDNRMYEWKFLLGLMRRYKRKRLLFPDRYKRLDRFPRTIREFDDLVTAPAFDLMARKTITLELPLPAWWTASPSPRW